MQTRNLFRHCYIATLVLNGLKFPNNTLTRQWFPDETKQFIYSLHFLDIPILVIEENAFALPAFDELREIKFERIENLKCWPGWSRGLLLVSMTFINTGLFRVNYNFFDNCSTSIITMFNSLRNTNLVNMFGVGVRGDIVWIHIEKSNSMRHIHAYDFTAPRQLKQLKLPHCNVEAIANNAFCHLIRLEEIDLTGNSLKTLPATLFDTLLEQRYLIALHFAKNPWQCNCELIRIRRVLNDSGIEFKDFPVNCSMGDRLSNNRVPNCRETSEISDHRANGKFCDLNLLHVSFPKIKIHLADDKLTISAPKTLKRYFLICIDQRGVKSRPGCHLLRTRKVTVTTSHIKQHETHMVCFLESKSSTRIWPMNCVSLCNDCDNWQKVWFRMHSLTCAISLALAVTISSVIIGMALGLLTVIFHPKLLIGANRIVMLRSSGERRERYTIFVMPNTMRNILDYR